MEEKQVKQTKKAKTTEQAKKTAEQPKKKSAGVSRRRSMELLFQPVFDVHLNMAIDYDVSLRIYDPQIGILEPPMIFPIAEKSNQICEIGKWMIEESCDAINRCKEREADINSVIIPISVKYFAKPYFVQQVIKIVEQKDVYPDKFCFNINESILEDTKDSVIKNIRALREYGFMIGIDDFGVEFTSLSNLSQYEVDYIGLNASLLKGIEEDERQQNAVQGIIDFAKKIGSRTKVDGVDSVDVANLLRKLGADRLSGPVYGKPIAERQIKI